MDFEKALRDYVKGKVPMQVIPCTVTAVDESACTCDVDDPEGIELYDVRLRAVADNQTIGLVQYPAVGSAVLVGRIGNSDSALVVLATSELDKVEIEVGASTVTVEGSQINLENNKTIYNLAGTGHSIEQGAESLKAILNDLMTQLEVLTVTCTAPGSPSSVPINVAAITAVKARLNTLFQ
jgi:hypothetical protein